MGEELPPFMIPPRYKLMFKIMQNDRNNTRLHRKEIPLADKERFAQQAKDWAMYVQANKLIGEEEMNSLVHEQINTDMACAFLPDYLRNEVE